MWFENDEVLDKALNSPEIAVAVEDSESFLDMERTSMIIVEEKVMRG